MNHLPKYSKDCSKAFHRKARFIQLYEDGGLLTLLILGEEPDVGRHHPEMAFSWKIEQN